jgi:LCP family protein required for cell wall assembly
MSESEKDWKLVAGIVLVVQLLIEVIALIAIFWLNVLPALYTVLAVLVLIRLLEIVYHLFYQKGRDDYDGKTAFLYIRRGLGCVVSALTMVSCILLSTMMAKASYAMHAISTTATEVTENTTDTPLLGAERSEEGSVATEPFVVYVSGSDTRSTELGTGRSDVNILLVVNPTTKQVLMVNTPRDYYVEISVGGGARDKLTHCGIYGIDCSMDTLSSLYDEKVNYYVQVNFSGFETLIDAIGGITVESEKTFRCSEGGYEIEEGVNELDGKTALSYARERKAFKDGDNARGRHQMQVIKAIIEKVSSGTTVLTRYSAILESMEGTFATNLTTDEMAALVRMQLSDGTAWNVKSFAVGGTDSSETTYSMPSEKSYVMIPDEEQVSYAQGLIDRVMAGEILTDADIEI